MVHGKTPNCGRWDFFAAVDIGVFHLRSALRVRACRKAASLQNAALRHFAGVQSSPDLTKIKKGPLKKSQSEIARLSGKSPGSLCYVV